MSACRAKAARDYQRADSIAAQLSSARVRVDDRLGRWQAAGGPGGEVTVMSVAAKAALRPVAETPESAAAAETERRRLKNKKKRDAKEAKRAAGTGTCDAAAGGASSVSTTCTCATDDSGEHDATASAAALVLANGDAGEDPDGGAPTGMKRKTSSE